MQKIVDLTKVKDAIRQIREDGYRVSCRNIRKITGGSLKTVLELFDVALDEEREIAKGPSDLSESLTRAVLLEIRCHVQVATEGLELRIAEKTALEQEILAGLDEAEVRVDALERELVATQAQMKEEHQSAEKATAVAAEQNFGLKVQLEKLTEENDHLIRAGEAARTQTAKAELKVERADLAAHKAEAQVQKLEGQIADLIGAKTEAEKMAAVFECHANDLSERIAELAAQVAAQAVTLQKGEVEAERIRQELVETRMIAANADKLAALADQKLMLMEGQVKKSRERKKVSVELHRDVGRS